MKSLDSIKALFYGSGFTTDCPNLGEDILDTNVWPHYITFAQIIILLP